VVVFILWFDRYKFNAGSARSLGDGKVIVLDPIVRVRIRTGERGKNNQININITFINWKGVTK